jgi:hypothetical protein
VGKHEVPAFKVFIVRMVSCMENTVASKKAM